jgi:hypothetical protein
MANASFTACRLGALGLGLAAVFGCSAAAPADAAPLSLTLTMKPYRGNPAYAAVYVLGPRGEYVSTLHVAGNRARYQADLTRWHRLMQRSGRGIDGTTGASAGAGRRVTTTVNVPDRLLNAGYTLHVETAVENGRSYPNDVTMPLDNAHMGRATAGTGYVATLTLRR